MHGMLKRAAASAIPVLLGLAVSPASAMAAPHTSRAVAGPVKGGQETHQSRRAGTTSTAETTADTYWSTVTDAGFAATPATPVINGGPAQLVRFSPVPGSVHGGSSRGIVAYGKDDKFIGNRIFANGGSGFSQGSTTGNGSVGTAGISGLAHFR
jgi:hypothetical protein